MNETATSTQIIVTKPETYSRAMTDMGRNVARLEVSPESQLAAQGLSFAATLISISLSPMTDPSVMRRIDLLGTARLHMALVREQSFHIEMARMWVQEARQVLTLLRGIEEV
ncbi:MAG: hypothetical protein GF355_04175, partial [Candidatus Eisenbacteria bacterium]|nr:hypothetical protein [Candidatus Eisenbacteria bacterium]